MRRVADRRVAGGVASVPGGVREAEIAGVVEEADAGVGEAAGIALRDAVRRREHDDVDAGADVDVLRRLDDEAAAPGQVRVDFVDALAGIVARGQGGY